MTIFAVLMAVILTIVLYLGLSNQENYLLSRPKIVNSRNDVDANKWYYKGKLVKSVTVSKGQNTSQNCGPEYPDTAWMAIDL